MAKIDPLLERNKHFATTAAREGISIVAKYPVYVITCLDPRTDPGHFLGLGQSDNDFSDLVYLVTGPGGVSTTPTRTVSFGRIKAMFR